jgi:protein-histidine N-methyltransferase
MKKQCTHIHYLQISIYIYIYNCKWEQLGCGTAIPSLALFAYLLAGRQFSSSSSSPLSSEQSPANAKPNIRFTFADYNSTVLRLVTIPNLLLTWKLACNRQNRKQNETVQNRQQDQQRPQEQGEEQQEDEDVEQDINPTMLNDFEKDLQQRGILIDFVSGAWSPEFVHMAIDSVSTVSRLPTEDVADTRGLAPSRSRRRLLVLASETIYAPASLTTFSETLIALLRVGTSDNGTTTNQQIPPPPSSRALLAAKKVYFGVGGGIDEFLTVLHRVRGGTGTVQQRSEVKTEGVGRVILEISF